MPPVERLVEPKVPRVHDPPLCRRRRRLLLFAPSCFSSSPCSLCSVLSRGEGDVKDQDARPRAVVGVDQRHLERAAPRVADPVRPPDLEGDDAGGVLHARGVVEDEGGGDRGAVDGAGAEAAGEAFFALRRGREGR